MRIRVAVGRDAVAREIRAAEPLAHRLDAPLTARAPWLTAALNARAAHRWSGRAMAVVVTGPGPHTSAAAFLHLVRRGPIARIGLLGEAVAPVPAGRPSSRLPAVDDEAAALLAAGICDLLADLRGPWSLSLAGLPLGDPTARQVAARYPAARMATGRSTRLVDDLDAAGPVIRSRDPRDLERELPALLDQEPDHRARTFLRAAARLHAATGELELAVRPGGGALLSLGPAADRWPWWATPGCPGVRSERGAPSAAVTVPVRSWLPTPDVARRLGGRRP